MITLNNYKNNVYANVFNQPSSWCGSRYNFCMAASDDGYHPHRRKTLEPLGSRESNGLFFHPGDNK